METRTRIVDFMPEMYRAILPDLFERPLAEERHATCQNCAMCPPEQQTLPAGLAFSPSTKCCTYHPLLPNYAVGGLLADESPEGVEGRRRIRDKIRERTGVAPIGIVPPPKQRLLYHHGKAGFGRAKALLCPYLDHEHGACTVWKYREAMCTTWFCKHNHGKHGVDFWSQLRDYLIGAQFVLSCYALRALSWDVDKIASGFPATLSLDEAGLDDAPLPDAAYAALWGEWQGREEGLYLRAYELVRALDRESFEKLGGLKLTLEVERLDKRYESLEHPTVPNRLLKNPRLDARRAADGSYILVSHSGIDPTRLRKAVYDLLDYFDGTRSTADVRAAIFVDTGHTLTDSLITKLYQHRILVDPRTSG